MLQRRKIALFISYILFFSFCPAFTGTRTSRHAFINKAIRKASWIDFMKTAFAYMQGWGPLLLPGISDHVTT